MESRKTKWNQWPFFFSVFALFTLWSTPHLLAQTPPPKSLCAALPTSSEPLTLSQSLSFEEKVKEKVRQYIEQRIVELEGGDQFSKYDSVWGLLQLANELSEVTDDILLIHRVVESVLLPIDFTSLHWFIPFHGTRSELEKLVNGFFEEIGSDFIRSENNQYMFLEENGESFQISDEEGFDRFVDRIFYGNREAALNAAAAILNGDRLRWLDWDEAYALWFGEKSKKQKRKERLEELNSPNAFERRIREIVKHGVLAQFFNEILPKFFENENNEEIDISGSRTGSSSFPYAFDGSNPEQEQRLRQQGFTPNAEGDIRVDFEATLTAFPYVPKGPLMITHKTRSLNLEGVNKFVKKLKVANIFFPNVEGDDLIYMGVILFSEANSDAIKEANKEGLFLVQVPEKENDLQILTKEDLELLNSETLQPTHF